MISRLSLLDYLIDNKDQLPPIEFKKAVLRIELCLVAIVVPVVYTIVDITNGIFHNLYYYLTLIGVTGLVLWLNKRNRFMLASIVFILIINILIYLFAAANSYRSAVYAYFVVSSITGLTLFGFDQIKLGLASVVLSIGLFVLVFVLKITPVVLPATLPEYYITLFFTINFMVSILTASVLLFFLLKITHDTEQALITKNDLLTKANTELDQFVYSASHDLRSPLSSIMGLVEIAKKSEDRNEVLMCLNLIDDRVKVQDAFIHDIVEYARNARMNFENEIVPLKSLLFEIIDQLMYMKEADEVDIHVQVEDDVVLKTDKNRIISVLSNLVGNAIKYQDTRKQERFVKIWTAAAGDCIEISVEDNGMGIPQHFHDKIFNMFFRASETSKGSGLGLFIVKETLQKMNGSIAVTSAEGKGSCFTVRLPLQ